jgi:hypothetical protein
VLSTLGGGGSKKQRMLPAVGQLATAMTTGLPGTDRVQQLNDLNFGD